MLKEDGGLYLAISYGKPSSRSMHFTREMFSWTLKEYIFYPIDYKDEQEKEEKSHYIYVCTKNDKWREVYKENFEKCIIKVILHEKNQALGKNDSDEEGTDDTLTGEKASIDIAKVKTEQTILRPKSA